MVIFEVNLPAVQLATSSLRTAVLGGHTEAVRTNLSNLSQLIQQHPEGPVLLAELERITAVRPSVTAADLDQTLERLHTTLGLSPANALPPWNDAVKEFLQTVWPTEILLPMRLIRDLPEFLLRAHKVMRHIHRGKLLENIRLVLDTLPDRRLALELGSELEAGGRLAGIFLRSGNSVSHAALRELVAFAGRATGSIAPTERRELRPATIRGWTLERREVSPKISPAEAALLVADGLESIAAFEDDLQALEDPFSLSLEELRTACDPLSRAVSDLEREAPGQMKVFDDILQLIDEVPEETWNGADEAFKRLTALLRKASETLSTLKEVLRLKEEEDADLRENERIVSHLDAALDGVRNRIEQLIAVATDSDQSTDESQRTASELNRLYARASRALEDYRNLFQNLENFLRAEEVFLSTIPPERREGAIADRIEVFETLRDNLPERLKPFETRLKEELARLQSREDSLPWSPTIPLPVAPTFTTRRFQAGPETPREILEILTRVHPRQYIAVNNLVELALMAPDAAVYDRLLSILDLRRRHGTSGYYIAYRDGDRLRDGHSLTDITSPRSDVTITLTDREGRRRSVHASQIQLVVTLSTIDPETMAAEINDTTRYYHSYKIEFYATALHINPSASSTYFSLFEEHYLRTPNADFSVLRFQFLAAHFLDDEIRTLLLTRLHAQVDPESIRRRLKRAGDGPKLIRAPLDFLAQRANADRFTSEEKDAFLYIYGFNAVLDAQPASEKEAMLAEVHGTPIEDIAPDLRMSGAVRDSMDSWTRRAGSLPTQDFRAKLLRSKVLSGPESSHLLFEGADTRTAQHFLKSRLLSSKPPIDGASGEVVTLKHHGYGYKMSDLTDLPASFWYHALIERLRRVAETPTAVSDVVLTLFENRHRPAVAPFWQELVGVLMELPADSSLSRQDLLDCTALWIGARCDRLMELKELKNLVRQWKSL